MLLMLASTVSADCQLIVEDWPQLMLGFETLKLPVAPETATVALAIPALKRGRSFSLAPAGQSLVVCLPSARLIDTFLPATTVTSPDQTVLPLWVTVRW